MGIIRLNEIIISGLKEPREYSVKNKTQKIIRESYEWQCRLFTEGNQSALEAIQRLGAC